MQKITPFLWFDGQAEEAATFYTSLFKDSHIENVSHYGENSPGEKGSVMSVAFTLAGQEFTALNGGPEFKFTPAISFFVTCEDQAEVDRLWDALLEGGEAQQCGWLTDRFGVSWQIIPKQLSDYLNGKDKEGSARAMQVMLKMVKIDIDDIKRAYEQG